MKMSASGQVEMSAFGDVASPERRSGGPGADQDEQQGAGPSRHHAARGRGTAHAGEGRKVHRPVGASGAPVMRGLRGARASRSRLGQARPDELAEKSFQMATAA